MQRQGTPDRRIDEAEKALAKAFQERFAQLYWLAYLITGDREQSMQAFGAALSAVDDEEMDVRRSLVTGALQRIEEPLQASIVRFEAEESCLEDETSTRSVTAHCVTAIAARQLERALFAIDVFPRCAVLLTV